MADLKISQLTAKGSAIAATDLVEISESDGSGGYVTKSVTGANIKSGLQATLVSGTNIKTVEGQSILGTGNIAITKTDVELGLVDNTSDLSKPISTATQTALNAKQDTLVSATNIKTINSTTILGSGDLAVQPTLVSGTNIKTINSNSILGSGNLVITGGVTSVSATTPVVATGTTTPVISLASNYGDTQNPYASKTANNFLAAPNGTAGVPTFRTIVGADIPTLNQNTTGTADNVTGIVAVANGGTGTATPSLVAGTNVTITGTFPNQTIAASSGGGGGGGGVHQLTKPISNQLYNARLTIGTNFSSGSTITNNISLYPFIPANSITIKNINTSVDSPAVVGGLLKILVYSDLNGVPSSKLIESTNIDASTTGDKTYITAFTFTAGTTYWLGIFSNLANIKIPIFLDAQATVLEASSIYGSTNKTRTITATFPNAPATLGTTTLSTASPFSITFTAL